MGGAASGRKGANYERKLVNALRMSGFGALRFPASGSATTRSVPDVMAAQPREDGLTELWGIELKSGKGTTLYVDDPEVFKLRAWARRWGARMLLGARFTTQATGRNHWLVDPDDARRTKKAYGLPVDDVQDRAFAVVHEDGETTIL